MATEEFKIPAQIWKILQHLYENVDTLDRFVLKVFGIDDGKLLLPDDRTKYRDMLRQTLVGTPKNSPPFSGNAMSLQESSQKEILHRVIQKLRSKTNAKKNLLTDGYTFTSNTEQGYGAGGSRKPDFQCPNQNVALLESASWKTLFERIGEREMEYLLVTTAIFVPLAASCYMQISGTPIYDLWSFKRNWEEPKTVRPVRKRPQTSLLNHSRKYEQKHKRVYKPVDILQLQSEAIRFSSQNHDRLVGLNVEKESVVFHVDEVNPVRTEPASCFKQDHSSFKRKLDKSNVEEPNFKIRKLVTNRSVTSNMSYFTSEKAAASTDLSESSTSFVSVSDFVETDESYRSALNYTVKCTDNLSSEHLAEGTIVDGSNQGSCSAPEPSGYIVGSSMLCTRDHETSNLKELPVNCNSVEEVKILSISDVAQRHENKNSPPQVGKKKRRRRKNKCLEFDERNAPVVNGTLTFSHAKILYCKNLGEHFPPKYLFFKSNAQSVSPEELMADSLKHEVGVVEDSGFECPSITREKLLTIFSSLVENHRKCRYKYLLKYHCDPNFLQLKNSHTLPVTISQLLQMNVDNRSIYLFIRACIVQVIPQELIGPKNNKTVFLKNVEKFLKLGRYEQFSLGQLMRKMKVGCTWLKDVSANGNKRYLFAKVMFWLIESYVIPLIQSYFYVTDNSTHRYRLFYYRKSVWRRIHEKGLEDYLGRRVLMPISTEDAKRMILSEQSLGIANLRFLPKSNSLRPIVNMSSKNTLFGVKCRTINGQLRNILKVLTYEKDRNSQILGSSTFSTDDIHRILEKFSAARKERGDTRRLYFVKVDIKDCYDSINQIHLLSILKSIFDSRKEYVTRKFASVIISSGRLKRTFHHEVCSRFDFVPNFKQYIEKVISCKDFKSAIFMDQSVQCHENSRTLLTKLENHIFGTIIKIGQKLYHQVSGIGQGASISTMLCNLYYGKMENEVFSSVGEDELLMRRTDDFLFVSPVEMRAREFLDLMKEGISAYNCNINPEKSLINFYSADDDNTQQLSDDALFSWCGLLFNPQTLDVKPDYQRYAGLSTRDTMTIDVVHHPGRAMRNRLKFMLRSKCHQIFLCTRINSVEAVAANVYNLLLLTAFKCHCYARQLPVANGSEKNPFFLVNLMFELSGLLHYLLRSSCVHISMLSKPVIRWMCFKAFTQKLSKHRNSYKGVLKRIGLQINTIERHIETGILEFLKKTVGTEMPIEFKLMKD